jgi:hypothetical protein
VANLEIFVKPVLGIPNRDFGVLCGVGIGIHSLNLLVEILAFWSKSLNE